MKKLLLSLCAILALTSACQCGPNTSIKLSNAQDSISYALGVVVGNSMAMQTKQMPFDTIDVKTYAKAIANSKPSQKYLSYIQQQLDTIYTDLFMTACKSQLAYGKAAMTPELAEGILNTKASAKRMALQKERDALAERNLQEGKSFLESNAQSDSVKTTQSGLQYKILVNGNGPHPAKADRVKVNYQGTLIDGTQFDANPEATFSLNGVIKAWQEAIPMMTVGSKWIIYAPADLAYGPRGAGDKIGPNATLIFTIELLDIVK